ncbi:MAG: sulfite oxidase [Deltaproteobacteria bacterium]|nr:sulfite oxidase [Deltaproteobacteria bacterium]
MERLGGEKRTGLFELHADAPRRADWTVFGRVPHTDRRGFLKGAGFAAMAAAVGAAMPFHRYMPAGFMPEALAAGPVGIEGKDGLTVLGARPLNAETPPHLLDDEVTPTVRHFIRNNGIAPKQVDAGTWRLRIDGLVHRPMDLSIEDLRRRFEVVKRRLTIECAGNGRAFFEPRVGGNQWTLGAVACSEWTGVRLADVLKAVGVKDNVVYTAHVGADTDVSGARGELPLSRGVPIEKAMEPGNLIAFGMNGGPLHPMNGAPLRLVIPGWPGSCSQKWLTRIWLRDVVHDGAKMTGSSYRVPEYPIAPGEMVPDSSMAFIGSMPVKSLITTPGNGLSINGRSLSVAGHAWAGDNEVARVDVSTDFGASWQRAALGRPANGYAWQRWSARLEFPGQGYYEVWARATDDKGTSQPFAIAWNPKGYLNNAMHRIFVRVS